jgi:hypothetical protein
LVSAALQKSIARLQKNVDRQINCISMSQDEFDKRKAGGDAFVGDVLNNKRIALL